MIPKIEPDSVSGKDILYLSKSGHGYSVDYFARAGNFYNYLPADYKDLALTLDDEKVHKNYADLLIPRAIGYSSQALSYFFRGQLDVEMGNGSLKVKNASSETMTGGQFELYYDNANEERTNLTTSLVTELSPGTEQTIPFNAPQDATSYMLVYTGQLGSEVGAVAGKFISGELAVITVSLNGIYGENLTKKVALVWNPASNSLEREPIDYDDTGFQQWYQPKIDIGNNMFGDLIDCGTKILGNREPGTNYAPVGSQPAGCSEFTAGMEDNIYNNGYSYLAFDYAGSSYYGYIIDSGFDFKAARNYDDSILLYPRSFFYEVTLPESPVVTTGFRVHRKLTRTGNYAWLGTPPAIWDKANESALWEDRYYGHLGMMGGFDGHENVMYPWATGMGDYADAKYFIPHWKRNCLGFGFLYHVGDDVLYDLSSSFRRPGYTTRFWTENDAYMSNRIWFYSSLWGQYSHGVIANVCLVQFVPCTLDLFEDYYSEQGNHRRSLTPDEQRTLLIQAQAVYVQQGTTGYDWVAAGRNASLEAQIITAIDMAYALNNIPANEIRETLISINIVK